MAPLAIFSSIPSEGRDINAGTLGEISGSLIFTGLGVLLLWIGFKRSRKADPIDKTESEIPLSHDREEKPDINSLDGKDHNSHQRMKDNYTKPFAVFIVLVALGFFAFLKTGFIIPNWLAAKEFLLDEKEIPMISDTELFLESLKIESLEPCDSLESMNLAKQQAAIWSENYKLNEVFSVSFLVQDGKAKSLVWCFVFRREEPEILIVLGSANKILKVGKQTKSAKFITDEKQEVQDWSYNPLEFNWHLRSIPINGKNRTVWLQKHWCRQPDEMSLIPWCDIFDSGTGEVIEKYYRSADTVGELFATPIGSEYEQVLTILKSDRTQAGKMKLIMTALNLRDRLEVFHLVHGEGASLFDENNSEYSKGVILTHQLRENGYLASVYYENGERGIIKDYLNLLLEQLPQNGAIHAYSNKERIAPLSIKTGGDKVHYFVKLTDWDTDTPVQTIFIRGEHTVETTVPLGSYRLKYAAGKTWLGEDELFGDETIYSKAEKRFDFIQEGNNASGYSGELILQTGGNLSTVHIPKSEW